MILEIDITDFVANECPRDYSASIAELGPTAARDTWQAAKDNAPDWNFLDTVEKQDAFAQYLRGMGFGDGAVDDEWMRNAAELNALCLQEIASQLREAENGRAVSEWISVDWDEYRERSEAGQVSGALYCGDDGRIYITLSE